jgi:hypothetical protein
MFFRLRDDGQCAAGGRLKVGQPWRRIYAVVGRRFGCLYLHDRAPDNLISGGDDGRPPPNFTVYLLVRESFIRKALDLSKQMVVQIR